MPIDFSILIGGAAGQGIQTVGDLIIQVCRKTGLHVLAVNNYESRIRGGHSNVQLRISDQPVKAPCRPVHLLVAMTDETIRRHRGRLAAGGLIVADSLEPSVDGDVHRIPISGMAEAAGGRIMANSVAAGACLALVGAPFELLEAVLAVQFKKTDAAVTARNLTAAKKGYEAMRGVPFSGALRWRAAEPGGLLMTGSRALALGAGFVARGFSGSKDNLTRIIQAAVRHQGFSLVDILQPCVSFNRINTHAWYKQRVYDLFDSGYDPSDRQRAMVLAEEWEDRIPIGIFYQKEGPSFTDRIDHLKTGPALVARPYDRAAVQTLLTGM